MCTSGYGPTGFYGGGPEYLDAGFPANGYFTSVDSGWHRGGPSGPLVELAEDVAASAQLGVMVLRPVQPLRPGDMLSYWEEASCAPPCSYCESSCEGYVATVVEPDLSPPAQPEITLHTLLVRDPKGPGAYGCGDDDALEIVVTVADATTPIDKLGLVVYAAPTVEEVAQLTAPTAAIGLEYGAEGTTGASRIYLGSAVGHERRGDEWFSSPDEFCMSVAAFDRAGNLSARSLPACVDTNDPDHPSVVWVESTACGCQSASGADLGTGAVLAVLVALVLRGTGRGRRRDTR